MTIVLHIAERAEWELAVSVGEYVVASLETEGFIHCSRPDQVVRVANALFTGRNDLILLCIDETKLSVPVKNEPPVPEATSVPSSQRFPHVYGPISIDAVTFTVEFPPNPDGYFSLPDELRTLVPDNTLVE